MEEEGDIRTFPEPSLEDAGEGEEVEVVDPDDTATAVLFKHCLGKVAVQ